MLNKTLIVWIIVGIFAVGMVVAANFRGKQEPASSGSDVPQPTVSRVSEQKAFASQTDSQAEVTMEVTPKSLEVDKEAVFQVTLNTHSVELDKDLAQISILMDDKGVKYQAVSWAGGTGGHHLSGDLTFPKISDRATSVELKISGIGGVERIFRWTL